MSQYQPDRGHFVWIQFSPQAGTDQAGHRPALVLSPQRFNIATGLMIACPITSQIKGGPFEVPVPQGMKIKGVVLVNQLKSLDWLQRTVSFEGVAPTNLTEHVVAVVEAIIRSD